MEEDFEGHVIFISYFSYIFSGCDCYHRCIHLAILMYLFIQTCIPVTMFRFTILTLLLTEDKETVRRQWLAGAFLGKQSQHNLIAHIWQMWSLPILQQVPLSRPLLWIVWTILLGSIPISLPHTHCQQPPFSLWCLTSS